MKSKIIKAEIFLGFYFVLHFFKKIFKTGRDKKNFADSYKNENLFAISEKHRNQMPDYCRCYFCHICDTLCPEIALNPQWIAPSFIVASFSRSFTDFSLFPSAYHCDSCGLCEQACPQNIPIREMIRFVQVNRQAA